MLQGQFLFVHYRAVVHPALGKFDVHQAGKSWCTADWQCKDNNQLSPGPDSQLPVDHILLSNLCF